MHTPGPWRVLEASSDPDLPWRVVAAAANIAIVCDEPEAEENAYGIAALPELLAACKGMLKLLQPTGNRRELEAGVGREECIMAECAIAKAEKSTG